ncbi:hypothetical protein CCUS01_08147 [Colletotrichum cuscutae]|uniref:Uncharacterized protein n=1 Tax=Colletotrichum cuscutae TaxID=1209917 RepID=A0AAI9US67_9PEZI|nr:hypothetical protein CCUS01_08147 [Colletotrichum cuscutae]
MGVFTPRPPSHNGKAGATMHLDERKVQVQPGSKSRAWYFDHVLPVVRTYFGEHQGASTVPMSPCLYVLGPPAIVPEEMESNTLTTSQLQQRSSSVNTRQQLTQQHQLILSCAATELCSVPSHPIPFCSSQPNGTMHARVCLGPPPITDAAPSSPSMLPLLLLHALPPPMPRLLAAVGPARPGTSPTDTSTVQAVSSTSCRGRCAAAAGPRPAGASSSPAPYLYPSSDERSMSSAAQRPPFPSLFHHPLPPVPYLQIYSITSRPPSSCVSLPKLPSNCSDNNPFVFAYLNVPHYLLLLVLFASSPLALAPYRPWPPF